MKECVFCKIARKEKKEEIVFESNNFIAFIDKKPRAVEHVLVIPKKHYSTLLDIPNNLGKEMLEFTKKVAAFLIDKKYGDGFNVIMNNLSPAGQVVMHAHIHIIPRKEGDGLKVIE